MKVKIKGIFVKTLLIILAVSFVLFGIINFFSGVGQSNIIKIGNERIGIAKFAKFLTEKKNQIYKSDLTDTELDYVNSKEFINNSLSEFISQALFQNQVKQLNIQEPEKAILNEIYNDPSFKDKNGKFDIRIFRNILQQNGINEEFYIQYLSMYNSQNNLMQILASLHLSNKFLLQDLFLKTNQYLIADIIIVNPKDLKFENKKPTEKEIKEYYKENTSYFTIPEEKIISFIEIDLTKYKDEEAKTKLSELEDFILSSKNIDEIANYFNVKKDIINYIKKDKNTPQDLTIDILQSDKGVFSDLIYKDNNIYKVYYIENIIPSKILTLAEATPEISNILMEKFKKDNDLFLLNKLITQIKNNDLSKVATRNNLKVLQNQVIYQNNSVYPEQLIADLYSLNSKIMLTKPVYDSEKENYIIGYLRETKEIPQTDSKFVSLANIEKKLSRSYNNSIVLLFQKYLFDTEKVIVNTKLLETLE